MAHVEHNIIDPFRLHDFAALFVDHLALVIHHVVILDDMLAHFIVTPFDLLLRGFDGFGQPFRTNRFTIGEIRIHHLGEKSIRAEDAEQIVL